MIMNRIHDCDICRFYNKCYPRSMTEYETFMKKIDVDLGGCPEFKELTIQEMFYSGKE